MSNLYIGLMSGTSTDGIDAALVDFSNTQPRLVATHYTPYTEAQKSTILSLMQPGQDEINRLGQLDVALGASFAEAVITLLDKTGLTPEAIHGIGSHGHTIRHHPGIFSLQIADPNIIAAKTGITTIADFRRKDIALGGQGAPLVPAFHQAILSHPEKNRAVVNIGGMANVTLLPQHQTELLGFDTGPGNALLDEGAHQYLKQKHDTHGEFARSGQVNANVLSHLLNDPYFAKPAPKSTGREYFNQTWLQTHINACNISLSPADLQATLTHLTAHSILRAIQSHFKTGEILICGGGAHNTYLIEILTTLASPHFSIHTTDICGISPDWMEAMAFAWLAKQTLTKQHGNKPSVTGATRAAVLGGVYTSL